MQMELFALRKVNYISDHNIAGAHSILFPDLKTKLINAS